MRAEIQEAITVLEKPLGVLVGMHTIMLKRQTAPTSDRSLTKSARMVPVSEPSTKDWVGPRSTSPGNRQR